MSVKIKLVYPHLQQATNNKSVVEVNGSNVGECINDLVRQFPQIRDTIFDKDGKLLDFIVFYINGESVYFDSEPLARPINDGDEILIALLLAGG